MLRCRYYASKAWIDAPKIFLVERQYLIYIHHRSSMQNQCIICCTASNTQIGKMIYQHCIILIGERHYFKDIENIMFNQLPGGCRCYSRLNW